MIFGRKKRQADTEPTGADAAEPVETAAAPVTDDAADTDDTANTADTADTDTTADADDGDGAATTRGAQGTEVAGTDEPGEDPEAEELDVEELDAQDWRTDGPWDASEVDPEQLEVGADLPRIDLGSVILTGVEGMELQLQVAEDTQQIVSAMMVLNEQVTVDDEVHELNSALEVAAFAAPRSPGFWSEIREEILEGAQEAGGSAGLTAGPFGVEVRRMMLLETPEGEQGYQPSRMWVVEGPRWILRGVVYGHGALEGVPGDHVEHIADVFRQIVVRRGDDPMAPGDLLPLRLPENMVEEPNEE